MPYRVTLLCDGHWYKNRTCEFRDRLVTRAVIGQLMYKSYKHSPLASLIVFSSGCRIPPSKTFTGLRRRSWIDTRFGFIFFKFPIATALLKCTPCNRAFLSDLPSLAYHFPSHVYVQYPSILLYSTVLSGHSRTTGFPPSSFQCQTCLPDTFARMTRFYDRVCWRVFMCTLRNGEGGGASPCPSGEVVDEAKRGDSVAYPSKHDLLVFLETYFCGTFSDW